MKENLQTCQPVIHPPPLAILGEPIPTTYVVDSMMVIVTKREDL